MEENWRIRLPSEAILVFAGRCSVWQFQPNAKPNEQQAKSAVTQNPNKSGICPDSG
jgi:hypothetical protein